MKLIFKQTWSCILVFLLFSGTSLAANYIVSGADQDPNANGIYFEDGIVNDAPKYTKGTWTLERDLGGMENGWVIRNGGTPVYRNYENPSPLVPLNDHDWYFLAGDSEPGLEITLTDSIPSLNEWGGIIMMAVLGGIGIVFIRRNFFHGTSAGA